jgi:hypothetical protein
MIVVNSQLSGMLRRFNMLLLVLVLDADCYRK